MRIVLVPLDERPANVRDPRMTADMAGAELVTPPAALLGAFRSPGDTAGLAAWLRDAAAEADGLVVAVDQLGHGGLLASRLSDEPAWVPASRLAVLAELRAARPARPIVAFSAVTRAPDADDATEEPAYWARHGRTLHRLFGLLARAEAGEDLADEVAALRAALPPAVVADALRRRLRNHQLTLAAVSLVADGTIDELVCCSDDTAPASLGTFEQRGLAAWAGVLGLGDRVVAYPGADEVGAVLVARLLTRAAGRTPRIAVRCSVPDGLGRVAPYEDASVGRTAAGQVRGVGGVQVGLDDAPDLVLAVHPPASPPGDWGAASLGSDLRQAGGPAARAAAEGLEEGLDADAARGVPVALADVAHANGADPAVVELLRRRGAALAPLCYGAWNTAGNTIGAVLAPAVAVLAADGHADAAAVRRLLVHRLVEDAGYMTEVRPAIRAQLLAATGHSEPQLAALRAVEQRIEAGLSAWLLELGGPRGGGLGAGFAVAAGSVRLPWRRTFEVDFALAATGVLS